MRNGDGAAKTEQGIELTPEMVAAAVTVADSHMDPRDGVLGRAILRDVISESLQAALAGYQRSEAAPVLRG